MSDNRDLSSEGLSFLHLQRGLTHLAYSWGTCRVVHALWRIADPGTGMLEPAAFFECQTKARSDAPIGRLVSIGGELRLSRQRSKIVATLGDDEIGHWEWRKGLLSHKVKVHFGDQRIWSFSIPRFLDILSDTHANIVSSCDQKIRCLITPMVLQDYLPNTAAFPSWIPEQSQLSPMFLDYITLGKSTVRPASLFGSAPYTFAPMFSEHELLSELPHHEQLLLLAAVLWIPAI